MEGSNQLNAQLTSQYVILKSNEVEWWFAFSFVGRLVAYIIFLVVLVFVVALILKFFENWDWNRTVDNTVQSPLQAAKSVPVTYGTCEEDLECGNSSSSSSGEDLYDGKICVICYDELRNCFFVPCGHCATCYDCAQRILDGESKTCPVCRRFIGKVRKIFT